MAGIKTVVKQLVETIKDPKELETQIKAKYPRVEDFAGMRVKERKAAGINIFTLEHDSYAFATLEAIKSELDSNVKEGEDGEEEALDENDIADLRGMLSEIEATDFTNQVLVAFVIDASVSPLYYRWEV